MDWTTVLVAIGPATVTGAVGYYAARFQRDASVERSKADSERARIEHAEAERQHRQGVYHHFLIVLERLDAMMIGFAPLTKDSFEEWLTSFYSLHSGIHLFGAQAVRDSLSPVIALIDQVGEAPDSSDVPFHEAMRDSYRSHRKDIIGATAGVIEAMRQDVAPELTLPKLRALQELAEKADDEPHGTDA